MEAIFQPTKVNCPTFFYAFALTETRGIQLGSVVSDFPASLEKASKIITATIQEQWRFHFCHIWREVSLLGPTWSWSLQADSWTESKLVPLT